MTPDKAAGLGNWTDAQIVTALTKGVRPDGRELAPVMPWRAFASLTADDVASMVMFLRTLPVVVNKVPGPFGPNDKPTSFVMKVLPPDVAGPVGPAPK